MSVSFFALGDGFATTVYPDTTLPEKMSILNGKLNLRLKPYYTIAI